MKTKTAVPVRFSRLLKSLVFLGAFGFLLAACTASISPAAVQAPVQPQTGGSQPVISQVVNRQEVINGYYYFFQDIYFTDPDGDAAAATYAIVSSSLPYSLTLPDTPIESTPEQQKSGALFVETTACWQKMELAYAVRIRDQAGSLSEPVLMRMSCATPPQVDAGQLLVSGLSMVLPVGAVLLLMFWLLFRKHPADRLPAIRSTVLLVLLIMVIQLLQGFLHEGGHSLYLFVRGVPITLYVHPFFFSGFSRPLIPASGISYDILGSAAALLVCSLVTIPLWKRRSFTLLPWVLLFPYSAMMDGFNVMGLMGDFQNVIQKTGLPAAPFLVLGALLMGIGILSFFSLLPLTGLDPRGNHALFVLPAAMWLISVLSLLVAHGFVPGSPINLEYFAGREILLSVNKFLFLVIGVLLAVLYVTLFRWLYPRLPGWLRTETAALTWKDLRLPAIVWAASLAIGLVIVI